MRGPGMKKWESGMPDTGLSAITVMVVDDMESMRDIVADLLEAVGVGQVMVAESGEAALAQLAEVVGHGRVDLIISDIEMPGMDGFEFVRRVRYGAVPAFKDVPILILTGRSTDATVKKARLAKINGYLDKPLDFDTLGSHLRDVLGL